ncbi:MAG: GAF domain-containing protein [Parvibaculum sp.]|uniref:GAF domain-containing protein n=1 Tax=Parvibaculum sp. TaxID=2024848 RepID=UPI0025DDF7C5|nr:GAF domain-containing protein [Parvibaculum sp.]MCE9648513.1 GAF domain-containing protein [Parvibaculum sp.]
MSNGHNHFIANSATPAVFVFDPVSGDAVSLNGGASQLIERIGLSGAPRLTLATIERCIVGRANIRSPIVVSHGHQNASSELRRECRRADGSVLALSRVWAPGQSTMLVVEDLTVAVQEYRRGRVWDMMVAHMARTEGATAMLETALRVFCLLSRSARGEIWLPEDGALVRRSLRASSQSVAGSSASRLKSADDSIIGQAWLTGKTIRATNRIAIPMHAGQRLVALLVLDVSPSCPSDHLAFALIESLAPLLGFALLAARQGEELSTMKTADTQMVGARVVRNAARSKRPHVVPSLRAAG